MNFFGSLLFLAGVLWLACYFATRFAEQNAELKFDQGFAWWVWKGALLPAGIWVLFNLGPSPGLPPLMPQVEVARGSGQGITALLEVSAMAVVIIASYWLAITLGWWVVTLVRASEKTGDFPVIGAIVTALLLPAAGAVIYWKGMPAAGVGLSLWLIPLAHCAATFVESPPKHPAYSRAVARIKFGKYREAEMAVIEELEHWRDDFEGWFMLADLYANHFHDLAGAHQTIRELSAQPNVTPVQMSLAAHRLADWYLQLAHDPRGARVALEELCERFPGTHVAQMARQRIGQLPASVEAILERQNKRVAMPALSDDFENLAEHPFARLPPERASLAVGACVEKLKLDPNDVVEREKLALLLAEALQQPDLAIEQLELLIQMPEQDKQKIPGWLSWIATWRLRFQPESGEGEKALQRLIDEYPQSAQAFAAQRRLNLMRMEARLAKHRVIPASRRSASL